MKDYGFDRKTDPDFWLKTSRAIADDDSLSQAEKHDAWTELVGMYQTEKRDDSARRAAKEGVGHLGEITLEQAKQMIISFAQKYDQDVVRNLYGNEKEKYEKEKAEIEELKRKFSL